MQLLIGFRNKLYTIVPLVEIYKRENNLVIVVLKIRNIVHELLPGTIFSRICARQTAGCVAMFRESRTCRDSSRSLFPTSQQLEAIISLYDIS